MILIGSHGYEGSFIKGEGPSLVVVVSDKVDPWQVTVHGVHDDLEQNLSHLNHLDRFFPSRPSIGSFFILAVD